MAESTTPRLGIWSWTADSDTPNRDDFQTSFQQLETLTAIDKQGTVALRPAAGVRGTYYWASDVGILYRDDGTGWSAVGSKPIDAVAANSAVGNVALAVNAIAGTTANLQEWKVNGAVKASINNAGDVNGKIITGTRAGLTATDPAQPVVFAKQAAAPTVDFLQYQDNTGANLYKIQSDGTIVGKFNQAGSGYGLVGGTAVSNVANLTQFSGRPMFEALGTKGGTSGTFQEFMYLHHASVDVTATLRRLGLLMRIGDEVVGDAGKTGAIYIESSAANAASPKFGISLGDTEVFSIPTSGSATFNRALTSTGTITSSVAGAPSFAFSGGDVGTQGTSAYLRVPSSSGGFYLYGGGLYTSTAGSAGTGGVVLAAFTLDGSNSRQTIGELRLTSPNDVTLGSTAHPFQIGSDTSFNMIADVNELQARNNGAASEIDINTNGGNVLLSSSGFLVQVNSDMDVRGNVTVGSDGAGNLIVNGTITGDTTVAQTLHPGVIESGPPAFAEDEGGSGRQSRVRTAFNNTVVQLDLYLRSSNTIAISGGNLPDTTCYILNSQWRPVEDVVFVWGNGLVGGEGVIDSVTGQVILQTSNGTIDATTNVVIHAVYLI